MSDIWTMIWKESKDSLFQDGWPAVIRPVILIILVGILLPVQSKRDWLALPPIAMLELLYIPFIFISFFVGDAIAGERERHTLETLLASRISDRAILLGKMIVLIGYAWGMILVCLVLGLVSANLSSGWGSWQFYTPFGLFLEAIVVSLLTSLLAASGGILISLRAATVRQAQQIMLLFTLVLVGGTIVLLKAGLAKEVLSLSYPHIMLLAIAILAIMDAILVGVSLASFQRTRLILS